MGSTPRPISGREAELGPRKMRWPSRAGSEAAKVLQASCAMRSNVDSYSLGTLILIFTADSANLFPMLANAYTHDKSDPERAKND